MTKGPDAVSARVDQLLESMSPEEKAGQLTQYFYFDLPPAGEAADQASGGAEAPGPGFDGHGITVDEALGRGGDYSGERGNYKYAAI